MRVQVDTTFGGIQSSHYNSLSNYIISLYAFSVISTTDNLDLKTFMFTRNLEQHF